MDLRLAFEKKNDQKCIITFLNIGGMSKRYWSVGAEWNCFLEVAIKEELTAGHPDKKC